MGRGRTAAAIGTAQTVAWASSYYLPAILADSMARDLAVSPSFVFGAFSVALLVAAALGPLVGRTIDRRGGRGVLLGSSLAFVAGLATLAWSPNVAVLATGWLILGVAMGMGLYDAAFATLARSFGHDARGAITGVTLMAGFASTIGGP